MSGVVVLESAVEAVGLERAMATIAMFMSVLIMKLTRNPVNDRMYRTTRAGIISAENKIFRFLKHLPNRSKSTDFPSVQADTRLLKMMFPSLKYYHDFYIGFTKCASAVLKGDNVKKINHLVISLNVTFYHCFC